MSITEKEKVLLQAIAQNEMNSMNHGVPSESDETQCWVNCLDAHTLQPGQVYPEASSVPGIVSSLSKKGLILTDGEVIELSTEGFEIWKHQVIGLEKWEAEK